MTDTPRTMHRFDPQQIGQLGSGVEMVADPDGEWVRASDHDDVVQELVEALGNMLADGFPETPSSAAARAALARYRGV